jgi:hypothetical protein
MIDPLTMTQDEINILYTLKIDNTITQVVSDEVNESKTGVKQFHFKTQEKQLPKTLWQQKKLSCRQSFYSRN